MKKKSNIVTQEDVERVHEKNFVSDVFENQFHEGGCEKNLIETYELIDKHGKYNRYDPSIRIRPLKDFFDLLFKQVFCAYVGARLALSGCNRVEGCSGFCYFFGGGNHHARYDCGAGFCLLNDVMIVARKLQVENRASLIWVVDVDVHKGCGTAEIIHMERERGILGTKESGVDIINLSVHMAHGWPLDEETLSTAKPNRAPLIKADVEIPLDVGEEEKYVPELKNGLIRLEELSAKSNEICHFPHGAIPDFVIVVDGADPYEKDELPSSGLLCLTLEQCIERDNAIYDYLKKRGIPSLWLSGGGYGEYCWEPAAYFLKSLEERKE